MQSKFLNRELSWISFNKRVLEEAFNQKHPILERLRFLSISGSNLDEFFMVRVSGLKAQIDENVYYKSIDDVLPKDSIKRVLLESKRLKEKQNKCWLNILNELKKQNIEILRLDELKRVDKLWVKNFYTKEIFPLLTPVAVDPAHPFPFVPNLGLCLVIKLERKKNKKTIKVVLPFARGLKQFYKIKNTYKFIKTEDLIIKFISDLFIDFKFVSYGSFRIIRDSDIEFIDEAEDLVTTFENQLKQRRYGRVTLLEISKTMPLDLKKMILNSLKIKNEYILKFEPLLDFGSIKEIYNSCSNKLKWRDYRPRFPERVSDAKNDCFAAIRKKDMIIHHPYESFEVVVNFLRQAAKDKKVLVIKQTIYRTAKGNNDIIEALVDAAEEGKSVTALLEIKARFDEEANIKVSRYLQRYGVQVVYGSIELKTHAKISLVVRKEKLGLNTYVHFGTGNYHVDTAKLYTDLSLFTCNSLLGKDAQNFFNMATGYTKPKRWNYISVAPHNLRKDLINLINNEIKSKRSGKNAEIWIKCNSLVDEELINALYNASKNNVRVELIVRGICCLKPQIKGLSENIYVKSIVGRFLEHSRIYCFSNGFRMPSSKSKVFISSADIMTRNFDRRYEIMVPILNKTVHKQILYQIMVANINDQVQAWEMKSDGSYVRVISSKDSISAHQYFMKNPSLSGRGESIKYNRPKEIILKK